MKTVEVYEIIKDEDELKRFISILPEDKEEQQFYFTLFARKKYNDVVKLDKAQLKRNITTKDRLIGKLRQLEVPFGCYNTDDGSPIPEDALACYIMPNPRSFKKTSGSVMKELVNGCIDNKKSINPKSLVMSMLQKNRAESYFIDFDYDCKDDGYINYLKENLETFLNDEAYHIIETRGGYHVLVMPHKITKNKKQWYNHLCNIDQFDQVGDMLIPIPGTIQGGFIVRML